MALQVKFRWWSFSGATACREFELFATTNVCICFAHRQWFPDTSHRCTTLYVHNAKSIALIYPNRLFVIIRQLMRMLSYSGRVASRNRSRFFFSLTIRFLRKCSRAFVIMWTANNFDGWCTQRSGKPFSCFRTKTCRHLFYRFWVRKVVSMANRKKRAATVDVETWERIFFFFWAARKHFLFFFRLDYWWGHWVRCSLTYYCWRWFFCDTWCCWTCFANGRLMYTCAPPRTRFQSFPHRGVHPRWWRSARGKQQQKIRNTFLNDRTINAVPTAAAAAITTHYYVQRIVLCSDNGLKPHVFT